MLFFALILLFTSISSILMLINRRDYKSNKRFININIFILSAITFIMILLITSLITIDIVIDLKSQILTNKVVNNYNGKIPKNGSVNFETTYCFKNTKVIGISFNGKCSIKE